MLKGKITISRPTYGDGKKSIEISVKDESSRNTFLTVHIGLEEFAEALTGLSYVDCDLEVRALRVVGKTKETKPLKFKMPEGAGGRDSDAAKEACREFVDDGWTASNYFGSQDSFFQQDGEVWAKTHQYRFV